MSKNCVTHHFACDCREQKFAELEAENAALRADRDRLDWLGSHQGLIEHWEGEWYCAGEMFTNVRAAIDAAMGEGKQ